jgi:hypothetical protein
MANLPSDEIDRRHSVDCIGWPLLAGHIYRIETYRHPAFVAHQLIYHKAGCGHSFDANPEPRWVRRFGIVALIVVAFLGGVLLGAKVTWGIHTVSASPCERGSLGGEP